MYCNYNIGCHINYNIGCHIKPKAAVLPVILLTDPFNKEKVFCQEFVDETNHVLFQTRVLFLHKLQEKLYQQQTSGHIFNEIFYH